MTKAAGRLSLQEPVAYETPIGHEWQPISNRNIIGVIDPNMEIEVSPVGYAIDIGDVRAEDTLHSAVDPETGDHGAARSIIDYTAIDPKLETLRHLIDSIAAGKNPDRVFPEGAKRHHFGLGVHVRTITTPFCLNHRGRVVSSGPRFMNVQASKRDPNSQRLHSDPEFRQVEEILRDIAGTKEGQDPQHRAQTAVGTLSAITNVILTQWASQLEIPQITSSPPELVDVGDKEMLLSLYVATFGPEVRYGIHTLLAEHNGPGRKRAALFNTAQIASTLKQGQPAFTHEETALYAGWLTQAKIARRYH